MCVCTASVYLLEIHKNNYSQNECYEAYCVADVINYARCVRRASDVPRKVPFVTGPVDGIDGMAVGVVRQVPLARHTAVSRCIVCESENN